MRLYVVLRYVGLVLLLNAAFLFLSSVISLVNSDAALFPLLYSTVLCLLFGIFPLIFFPSIADVTNNEGLSIVVAGWLVSCLTGALPYVLWGGEFDFTNAFFESVSGYTTTGSSILTEVETLPLGLLFWRSATHWIGGVGIIVFVLAVLPFIGVAEVALYRAEISSSMREKLNYRARKAVHILLIVYAGLTLAETLLLLLCGMNLFDAATHSFATIATGGFSTKNASIAYYQSLSIELVIIVFMVLSGMPFVLLFSAASGNIQNLWTSTSVRYYLAALFIGVVATAVSIHGHPVESWGQSIRQAAFQVATIGTSTGFATADSSVWPPFAQLILIFFILQGACTGSTSGGIKVERIVLLGKAISRMTKKIRYPSDVILIKLDNAVVDQEIVGMGILYISLYLLVVFISTLLLAALGVDLLSAFSGAAACMGGVGPGLGTVGSMGNFHHIPAAGKWILSFTMLMGRLEIYGLLVFLLPRPWK